jgi:hypothetical protein
LASEKQIAANRRNAQKSIGPKSERGKKRSSKNAFRHGLSIPVSAVESEARLKELSRRFARDAADAKILALAEKAADAQLELARVREIQTAMIERALIQGASRSGSLDSQMDDLSHPFVQTDCQGAMRGESLPLEASVPRPEGKEQEVRPFLDDISHILAELTKIDRYQKRAAGRRDRAIREIVSIKTSDKKHCNRSVYW